MYHKICNNHLYHCLNQNRAAFVNILENLPYFDNYFDREN